MKENNKNVIKTVHKRYLPKFKTLYKKILQHKYIYTTLFFKKLTLKNEILMLLYNLS